ncbi:MAG: hypothetical protein KJ043_08295, partial [Anaerolineae bacterium]|nr:hypothetical protein [Anaerolineae bacterium]
MDVARLSRPTSADETEIPMYQVQHITPIALPNTIDSPQGNISTTQSAGSQKFINLLCQFSGN